MLAYLNINETDTTAAEPQWSLERIDELDDYICDSIGMEGRKLYCNGEDIFPLFQQDRKVYSI